MNILPMSHAHRQPGILLPSESDVIYCYEGDGDHTPQEPRPVSVRAYQEGFIGLQLVLGNFGEPYKKVMLGVGDFQEAETIL